MIWLALGFAIAAVLFVNRYFYIQGYNRGWDDCGYVYQTTVESKSVLADMNPYGRSNPDHKRTARYQETCPFRHEPPPTGTVVENAIGIDVGVITDADAETVTLAGGTWITYTEMARRNWRLVYQ